MLLQFFVGCDSNRDNTQLNEANAKIAELTSENQKLREQNSELRQFQETLMIDHKELKEWAEKLVDGYGPGIWYISDSINPLFVKPVTSGNINEIIRELNQKFKQDRLPLITLFEIKGETVYVRIGDAEILTQQMGTHGASTYLNAITYSLASVNEIKCVIFDFEEGDHAVPGKYCK